MLKKENIWLCCRPAGSFTGKPEAGDFPAALEDQQQAKRQKSMAAIKFTTLRSSTD